MSDIVEQPAVAPPMASAVLQLQKEILQLPQVELPTEHIFHGGMYCRQVWRPAGTVIVGRVHKHEHFYMVVYGIVLVTTDDGAQELTGPFLLCSSPGTKRAVYAVTDALCMTIHRTDSSTVEAAEVELVETDPDCPFLANNKLKVLS